MFFFGDSQRRHSLIDRGRQRSEFWSCLDSDPENSRRLRTGKESIPARLKFHRACLDASQFLLDLFHRRFRFLSDELQCYVQRLGPYPARIRRKPAYTLDEAGDVLANAGVDVESDEDAHGEGSSF